MLTTHENINEICKAIKDGNNMIAIEALGKVDDINSSTGEFYRLLDIFTEAEDVYTTPLLSACRAGNADMIHYLIDHGADPNYTLKNKSMPLEIICSDKYAADSGIVQFMLEAGCDPQLFEFSDPVFSIASKLSRMKEEYRTLAEKDIAAMLKIRPHILCTKGKYKGSSLFHYAASIEDGRWLKTLLQDKTNLPYINSQDASGETPIMYAVNSDCVLNVVTLIDAGADTDIRDAKGKTVFEYASGKDDIIKILNNRNMHTN